MPKVDCCGKELKECICGSRSRSRERREKEAKAAAENVAQQQESPPAWALNMRNDILQGVRGAVQDELKPMKEEIAKVKETVSSVEERIGAVEVEVKDLWESQKAQRVDAKLEKRMKDVEEKILDASRKVVEGASTILFGGLQSLTFEEAQNWITRNIKERKLEAPEVIYVKGDEFTALTLAKFATTRIAEDVVRKMSISQLTVGEDKVWCKKDLPLDRRVPVSFLLGTRKQLIEWGYSKQKVKVKEEDNALVIGGITVLKVVVQDYQLKLDWTSDYWKNWTELVDSHEFKNLLGRAQESLKKARDDKGKGDGKGKSGY